MPMGWLGAAGAVAGRGRGEGADDGEAGLTEVAELVSLECPSAIVARPSPTVLVVGDGTASTAGVTAGSISPSSLPSTPPRLSFDGFGDTSLIVGAGASGRSFCMSTWGLGRSKLLDGKLALLAVTVGSGILALTLPPAVSGPPQLGLLGGLSSERRNSAALGSLGDFLSFSGLERGLARRDAHAASSGENSGMPSTGVRDVRWTNLPSSYRGESWGASSPIPPRTPSRSSFHRCISRLSRSSSVRVAALRANARSAVEPPVVPEEDLGVPRAGERETPAAAAEVRDMLRRRLAFGVPNESGGELFLSSGDFNRSGELVISADARRPSVGDCAPASFPCGRWYAIGISGIGGIAPLPLPADPLDE